MNTFILNNDTVESPRLSSHIMHHASGTQVTRVTAIVHVGQPAPRPRAQILKLYDKLQQGYTPEPSGLYFPETR